MDQSSQDQPEGSHTDAADLSVETSRPLVPLQPGQKRQAHDPSQGIQRQPAVFKSPRTNEVLKPVARHAYNPWLSNPSPSMRERHSAPHLDKEALSVELRSSKSAPDLRAPIMAAIKGLQDGSIQVDHRTRAKIAHAARRVLEARELRRRTSQEAFKSQGPPKLSAQDIEASQSRASTLQGIGAHPSKPSGDGDGRGFAVLDAPGANGPSRSLDLPRAEFRRQPGEDAASQDDTHMQFGEVRPGKMSPFTVTTGVPKFHQDGQQSPPTSAMRQARTRSTPLPLVQATKSPTLAALPRSLDFASELQQAAQCSKQD